MEWSKLESVFLVTGILISPFVFTGQCSGVKKEKDYIVFPKAFFSSNADQLKTFLMRNSVIENRAYKKVMTSPLEQPLSNSSDVSTSHGDHDTTSAASSPGFSTEFAKDVPQWHHWNGSFYTVVSTTQMTWEDAVNACSSMREGAHLVFIESELENEEVSHLAKVARKEGNNRWWIGLTDKDTEGVWKWYNVSLNYDNWSERQPDNARGNEDCGELGFKWSGENAFWNDARCIQQKKFICESGFGNDL